MPTIKESELDSYTNGVCNVCFENAGDIWLCGEGYVCTSCFSVLADMGEEEVFQEENINSDVKDKVRGALAKETLDAQS